MSDALRKAHPLPWRFEYDNDTGAGDEGFWEWWTVVDANGAEVCQCKTEAAAAGIIALAASPADVVGEIVAMIDEYADASDPEARRPIYRLCDAIASRFSTSDGWNRNMDEAPRGEYVLVYCPDAAEWGQVLIAGLLEFENDPDPPDWYEPNADRRPCPLDVEPTAWRHLPPAPGETDEA